MVVVDWDDDGSVVCCVKARRKPRRHTAIDAHKYKQTKTTAGGILLGFVIAAVVAATVLGAKAPGPETLQSVSSGAVVVALLFNVVLLLQLAVLVLLADCIYVDTTSLLLLLLFRLLLLLLLCYHFKCTGIKNQVGDAFQGDSLSAIASRIQGSL